MSVTKVPIDPKIIKEAEELLKAHIDIEMGYSTGSIEMCEQNQNSVYKSSIRASIASCNFAMKVLNNQKELDPDVFVKLIDMRVYLSNLLYHK